MASSEGLPELPDFANLLKDADGTPFPSLIEHYYKDLDFAEALRGLEAIPAEDIDRIMEYIGSIMPGAPLAADCLATHDQLAEKKSLNSAILNKLRPDQPGIEAGVDWQSSCAYPDIFSDILAKSPVLTQSDIEWAKRDATPKGGTVYFFEQLKTTQKEAAVTEWHWIGVLITDDGKEYRLEGVWTLDDIPSANNKVVADCYGEATRKFRKMPRPDNTFTKFHGTEMGPEDMTLGGHYTHETTYAVVSEKIFDWNREAKGRPLWCVRSVLEFNDLHPEMLGNFIAVSRLIERSNERGAPVSAGTHYALTSCLKRLTDTVLPDKPELQNCHLGENMVYVASTAQKIYKSNDRNADMNKFLTKHREGLESTFSTSNFALFVIDVTSTMQMPTVRLSHDQQPPLLTTYFANHQEPENEHLAKILRIAFDVSVKALKAKLESLEKETEFLK